MKLRSDSDKISFEEILLMASPRPPAPPPSMDLRHHLRPVRDQGKSLKCMAIAAADMMEFQQLTSSHRTRLSADRLFADRSNPSEIGMHIKECCDLLRDKGIGFDNNDEREYRRKYRIKSHAKINTLDGLKQAIVCTGPVLAVVVLYSDSPTDMLVKNDRDVLCIHALLVVGYDTDGNMIVRNSWGEEWGDGGYTKLPAADVMKGHLVATWTTKSFMRKLPSRCSPRLAKI
jgi:C1A family cysteine protease